MSGKHKVKVPVKKKKTFPCDWKGCSGDPHVEVPPYKDRSKGDIEKKPINDNTRPHTYKSKWPLEAQPYRTTRMGGSRPTKYRFQRHHVIPANMRKQYPDLFGNLLLMGWDLNCPVTNGINLPMYDADIVWNDLQPHRGSHDTYDSKVAPLLDRLEGKCVDYCKNLENGLTNEVPDQLKDKVAVLVKEFREHIINWDSGWNLVTSAMYNGKPRETRAMAFANRTVSKTIPTYPRRTF
jgi:hypothetical protein